MVQRKYTLVFILLVPVIVILWTILTGHNFTTNKPPNPHPRPQPVSGVVEEPSKFLYLVQTKSCLSPVYKSPTVFGNSSSCACDVIVLSYKKPCTDTSLPHVQYIFNSQTTWTSGRNLLYRTAMQSDRKIEYLYYIFIDDDIDMRFRDPNAAGSGWREFEKSLKHVQPAIATSWPNVETIFPEYYRGQCKEYSANSLEFLHFRWFDAMYSAFHYKVVSHLLPYYEKLEQVSVWYSQVYLIVKTDLLFPGQLLHQLNIFACNSKHDNNVNYPRVGYNSGTVRAFKGDLLREIPQEYHKELIPKLEDWEINLLKIGGTPPGCPPLPQVTYTPFSNLHPII